MKKVNDYVCNIVGTIKEFNWKLTQIYVENNCVYAEVIKKNLNKEIEGLYSGADDDPEDVYKVFYQLKKVLDFQGLLNDNDIM